MLISTEHSRKRALFGDLRNRFWTLNYGLCYGVVHTASDLAVASSHKLSLPFLNLGSRLTYFYVFSGFLHDGQSIGLGVR